MGPIRSGKQNTELHSPDSGERFISASCMALHRPVTIGTDKAHSYRRVIRETNHRYDPHFDSIRYIDRKMAQQFD